MFSRDPRQANAIDGSLQSLFASNLGGGNWLSVRVPTGTRIGFVAVHNVQLPDYASNLGAFEVWVGSTFGDTATEKCGEASYAAGRDAPYLLWCGGQSAWRYVTVKQTGPARYLFLSELQVFLAPPPPPQHILVLGSSVARGWHACDGRCSDETGEPRGWAQLTGEALVAHCGAARVTNEAVPGYNVNLTRTLLPAVLQQHQPDAVIIGPLPHSSRMAPSISTKPDEPSTSPDEP